MRYTSTVACGTQDVGLANRVLPFCRDIAIHAKEILRVRERLNNIYVHHLTKPHTVEEIGIYPPESLTIVSNAIPASFTFPIYFTQTSSGLHTDIRNLLT
jgi:hypothetical protein